MRKPNNLATRLLVAALLFNPLLPTTAQTAHAAQAIQAARPATTAAPAQTALQDPAAVSAEVEAFLLTQAQILPGTPNVSVTPPRIQRQAACDQLDVFLSNPQLRSRMSVGVRCLSPQPWTLYVQAALDVQGYYYVANRTINVGESVSMDDLVAREGDLLRLARNIVMDPSQAIGHIAQQRIPAGTSIKSSALRDPESIVRGQPVKTEARGVGFVATGEGVALEDGAPGTSIQVRTGSGQTLRGTVVNSTTVRIMM